MLETENDPGLTDPGYDGPQPSPDLSDTDDAGPGTSWPVSLPSLNTEPYASLGPGLLGDLPALKATNEADRNTDPPFGFTPSYSDGRSNLGPGLLSAGLALLSGKTTGVNSPSQSSGDGQAPVMTTSPQGRTMIKSFEGGAKPRPYASVEGGADSVGIGHKIQAGEKFSGDLKAAQINALFDADIKNAENLVRRRIGAQKLTQNQFDALVSFAFSTPSAFSSKTEKNGFLDRLQSGDLDGAANRMILWDRAGPVDSMGVQRRRLHEWDMFVNNHYLPF